MAEWRCITDTEHRTSANPGVCGAVAWERSRFSVSSPLVKTRGPAGFTGLGVRGSRVSPVDFGVGDLEGRSNDNVPGEGTPSLLDFCECCCGVASEPPAGCFGGLYTLSMGTTLWYLLDFTFTWGSAICCSSLRASMQYKAFSGRGSSSSQECRFGDGFGDSSSQSSSSSSGGRNEASGYPTEVTTAELWGSTIPRSVLSLGPSHSGRPWACPEGWPSQMWSGESAANQEWFRLWCLLPRERG
mmetsp:Transcript_76123/g.203460  ORF Transcript_76123/g.203460 Transcript_76123/m.203460 type:complete len:243 (-) Transcript_76123:2046-2774(-)